MRIKELKIRLTDSFAGTGGWGCSGISCSWCGSSSSISCLCREVGEALSSHNFGDTQSRSIKWGGKRCSGVGILDVRSANGRIDERNDTSELLCGWEGSIAANSRDGNGEGVEVLLSGDETTSSGNDCWIRSESGDDLVCLGELERLEQN